MDIVKCSSPEAGEEDGMGTSMEGWGGDQYGRMGWGGSGRMGWGWGPVKSKPCESEPAVSFGGGWEGVASFGRGVALARGRGVGTASSDPVVLP